MSNRVSGAGSDQDIVHQAACWMARLWSDNASAADRIACDHWRGQRPEHERAWQRLQLMEQKFSAMPDPAARQALHTTAGKSPINRRKALQALGLVVAVGGAAQLIRRSDTWRSLSSDYASAVGEIRELTLPDGTQVVLNTNSAIDIDYSADQRRILLRAGEILVTTAPDNAPRHRPLSVIGRDGAVRALGTRFTVRQDDRQSSVAVMQGAVEIHPRHSGHVVHIDAGYRSAFSASQVDDIETLQENAASWSRGVLVAEQLPIRDFLSELGRYRPGVLRCASDVGDLRVSGVFSLRDTDRSLSNLTLALPLQVSYRTRYWVTVFPL
ncbi:FecR domain-containing protein [Herbaspirillum sp. alder98]|uniref:FecR domain-containing protein n=1 Tax=Herbaspirillum sp. alder98 TaxID=2913096 RepID=UPI001CD8651B|nr:FecR domain-containing protein [Herbaspirillum sp. alder98]MCA1326103.1 FecR domain-containing protein [Herbaspirillum sp. alder98]